MKSPILWIFCCLATVLPVVSARAQSYTPYTSDAATLHLWHLDWSVADAGTVPVALGALGGGATLGNTSVTGLGTALSTVDGGAYVSLGTGTDAYLAVSTLVNGDGDNTSTTLVNTSTGAFTFEAVVQFAFDPLSNLSVRNSTSNAPMQILSGEQDSTGTGVRSFQFRFDPVGFTPGQDGFTTALSAPAIEFISVRNGSSPEYKIVQLPTTGANAAVQGAWYHVAITYTGSPGTAGNMNFYWTRLDGSQSQAALLGTKTLANNLTTGAVDLAIGNIGRSPSQNNFVGYIDEVRISSSARAATDMMPARYDAGGHVSAAPTNLAVTATSRTELSLSWSAVAGATGYNVKRATTTGGPYTTIASSDNVLTESYVDSGLTYGTTYYYVVSAVNSTGESVNSSQASGAPQPVYFTQLFSSSDRNDTPFNTYTFAPSTNENGYTVSRARTSVFLTDTSTAAGGTALTMSDDTYAAVTLANSVTVPFYGTSYGTFYVGSNGYITFGSGDSTRSGTLANHFAKPRISALFRNLVPTTGQVTWRQLSDRVAVTWQNVPQSGSSDLNNFQIEIFTGGTIRITTLAIAVSDGVIGLSRGTGTPTGFTASNYSSFPTAFVDTDGDGLPDWWELQYFGNLNQTGSGDPDGDGIDNLHEYLAGTNPTVSDNTATDSDGDGLPDAWEQKYFGNLTQNAAGDYDRDGITNGAEYAAGTDPTNPNSVPGDVDGDGLPDAWEQANLGGLTYGAYDDPDGDGYNNLAEMIAGTNPLDANSHPSFVSPRVTLLQDSVPASDACLLVSTAPYGRALNGEEFQTPILTYDGYQYAAWYNTSGSTQTVYLGRRTVNGTTVGAWETVSTGSLYTNGKSGSDTHNVVSIGVCPADGTLHMSWDMHDNTMRYRRSVVGLCTTNKAAWGTAGMMGAEQSKLASADAVNYDGDVTYPAFVNAPDGTLYLQRRYGITNNGDQLFQKYNPTTGTWSTNTLFSSRAGTYTGLLATGYGTSSARNGYPNGFSFGPDGTIHHTFTYREQADSSNHDINYIYSTDSGVTWRNNVGTVIADTSSGGSVNVNSAGIKMKVLDSRQLFINQQSQCVDNDGRVHVLGLHRRAEPAYAWQSGDATFTVVDTAYYHYFRDPSTGVWSQRQIPPGAYPVGSRPKIVYDYAGNVYAIYVSYASNTTNVVPGYGSGKLVVASASKASQYTDWSVVQVINGSFTGDPLADQGRLLSSGVLSVYIQESSTTTSLVATPLHVYDFAVPNATPTLAAISDQTMNYGAMPISLTATVADQDTPVGNLTLTGASSNTALVPAANIVISGTGSARTVTVTPVAGVTGTTVITLTVSDGTSTASRTFNLTVLNQAQTWRQQYFGTTANTGNAADTADPDGDGVPNLLERAFGGDPTVANQGLLPALDTTAPLVSITYYRAKAATDLTFVVQECSDLSANSWTTASGTSTLLSDDGVVQRYRFTAPANSAGKKFLRVQVTAP